MERTLMWVGGLLALLIPIILIWMSFATLGTNDLMSIMLLFLGSLVLTLEALLFAVVVELVRKPH